MSIASQIEDYADGLSDAYAMVAQRGGTMPAQKNMNNLTTAIATIPSGGGGTCPPILGKIKYHPYAQMPARAEATAGTVTNSTALVSYFANTWNFPSQWGGNTAHFEWSPWLAPAPAWACWGGISMTITTADFEANGFTPPAEATGTSFDITVYPAGPGVDTSTTLEYEFKDRIDVQEMMDRVDGPTHNMSFDNGTLSVNNEQLKEIIIGEANTELRFMPNYITEGGTPYYAGPIPNPPEYVATVARAYNTINKSSLSGFDIEFGDTLDNLVSSFQDIQVSGTIRLPATNRYGRSIEQLVSQDCLYSSTSGAPSYQQGITIITGDATATAALIAALPDEPANNKYRNLINGDL